MGGRRGARVISTGGLSRSQPARSSIFDGGRAERRATSLMVSPGLLDRANYSSAFVSNETVYAAMIPTIAMSPIIVETRTHDEC